MAVSVYYASDTTTYADGESSSTDAVHANAAAGPGDDYATSGLDIWVGQTTVYRCYQSMIYFNLAGTPYSGDTIPSGATISSATLSVWGADATTSASWTVRVFRYGWVTQTTGNPNVLDICFRSNSQLDTLYGSGAGQFASAAASSSWPSWQNTEAWVAFTSGSSLVSDITASIGGRLELLFACSKQMGTISAPSGDERIAFASARKDSGVHEPKISITWTASAGFTGLTVIRDVSS